MQFIETMVSNLSCSYGGAQAYSSSQGERQGTPNHQSAA